MRYSLVFNSNHTECSGLQLDLPVLELKDQIKVPGWNVPKPVSNTVIASIVLDFVLAGSELFHRIRVKLR